MCWSAGAEQPCQNADSACWNHPWMRPCRNELLCKVAQVPEFPAMLTKSEFSKLYGTGKACSLKLWYNFKCEMSLRKMLYTSLVVETEVPTKACYTGHSCFPLQITFTQRSVFFPSITTHLANFCRFSALRRLYSALVSHLGFSLSLISLWNRSTWATDSETGRAGGAFGILEFARLLHFFPKHLWLQLEAGCWSNWTHICSGNGVFFFFLAILVFLTCHFTICSLCW